MNLSYKKLEGKQRIYLNVPIIFHRMAGTKECTQDKDGVITLTYEDGSTESALLPEIELAAVEEYFPLVRKVQASKV